MATYTPGEIIEEFKAIGPTLRTCVIVLNVAIFESNGYPDC